MLVKAIEKEKKRTKEEGRVEGIEVGIEKGIEKEKVETVKIMLLEGFNISMISKVARLPEDEILRLKENLQN